jgi:hypothetical protein
MKSEWSWSIEFVTRLANRVPSGERPKSFNHAPIWLNADGSFKAAKIRTGNSFFSAATHNRGLVEGDRLEKRVSLSAHCAPIRARKFKAPNTD